MGHGSGMGPGPMAGLCIGLILFAVILILLVLWCIRLRQLWVSGKHAKIPNHILNESIQNQLYRYTNTNDVIPAPGRRQALGYTMRNAEGPYPYTFSDGNLNFNDQPPPYYSLADASTSLPFGGYQQKRFREPHVTSAQTHQLTNILRAKAAAPSSAANQPSIWSGDLSSVDSTGSTSYLYAGMQSAVATGGHLQTSKSRGSIAKDHIRSSGRRLKDKLRSKVQTAAIVSQLSLSYMRGRGSNAYETETKSRLAVEELDFSNRYRTGGIGEGYCNMNVISDKFDFDDLRSLDSDAFLFKLENAVCPGLVEVTPSLQSNRVVTFADRVSSASDAFVGSDFRNLANADLGLGAVKTDFLWQSGTKQVPLMMPFKKIQFPAPGPPVTGWAYLFFNTNNSSVHPSDSSTKTPTDIEAFGGSLEDHSVPQAVVQLSPPPATTFHPSPPTDPFQLQVPVADTTSVTPSSVAVPRRRPQHELKRRRLSGPGRVGPCDLTQIDEGLSFDNGYSKSTLANTVETFRTRLLSPSVVAAPVDSGYHDSLLLQSLNLSEQSLTASLPSINESLSQTRLSDVIISQGHLLVPSHPITTVCTPPKQVITTSCLYDYDNPEDATYTQHDPLELEISCSSNGTSQASRDSSTVMLPKSSNGNNGCVRPMHRRLTFPLRSSNSSPAL